MMQSVTRSASKRRVAIEKEVSDDATEKRDTDISHLEMFYGTTWYMFKLTPLYKFGTMQPDLLSYSRRLAAAVQAHLVKDVGVVIGNGNSKIKATFVTVDGFARHYTDTAVLITVTAADKTLFRGVLCSAGTSDLREHTEFATLPLFLTSGNQTVRTVVLEYLKNNFNCFASRLTFPTAELVWMATMWACSEDNELPLVLIYSVPLKELSTVRYEISRESVEPIWKFVKGSSDHITEDEVNQFIELLEKHFFFICRIKPFTFQLAEIGTSAAFVNKDGKIKILSQSAVYKVLSHLTTLCKESLFLQQENG